MTHQWLKPKTLSNYQRSLALASFLVRCQAGVHVCLVAPYGIGKSRLVEMLRDELGENKCVSIVLAQYEREMLGGVTFPQRIWDSEQGKYVTMPSLMMPKHFANLEETEGEGQDGQSSGVIIVFDEFSQTPIETQAQVLSSISGGTFGGRQFKRFAVLALANHNHDDHPAFSSNAIPNEMAQDLIEPMRRRLIFLYAEFSPEDRIYALEHAVFRYIEGRGVVAQPQFPRIAPPSEDQIAHQRLLWTIFVMAFDTATPGNNESNRGQKSYYSTYEGLDTPASREAMIKACACVRASRDERIDRPESYAAIAVGALGFVSGEAFTRFYQKNQGMLEIIDGELNRYRQSQFFIDLQECCHALNIHLPKELVPDVHHRQSYTEFSEQSTYQTAKPAAPSRSRATSRRMHMPSIKTPLMPDDDGDKEKQHLGSLYSSSPAEMNQ